MHTDKIGVHTDETKARTNERRVRMASAHGWGGGARVGGGAHTYGERRTRPRGKHARLKGGAHE
jgi:hypothetical protein